MAITFCEYGASASQPNVVVDGSPNEATVLTLTHWPGIAQPPGMQADLSAQMAFRFVRSGLDPGADVVTNNHFDQHGLIAMFALIAPEQALAHEALLADIAAAGDFATYRFRDAARTSMAIAAYADAERSPIASELTGPYAAQCAALYVALLPLVLPIALDPAPYRDLWADEDAELAATEAALATGAITIEQQPEVDLAIVRLSDAEPARTGHRFAADEHVGAHPMAIHNATSSLRMLEIHGKRFSYTDRYETWVQYRTRRPLPRVDLRPLADSLTAAERGGARWRASAPSVLTPQLASVDESSLDEATVLGHLTTHLATADPAWDPYTIGRSVSDTG